MGPDLIYHTVVLGDPSRPERPSEPWLVALFLSMNWWNQCRLLRAIGEQTLREHEWFWTDSTIAALNELTGMLEGKR
jgi:hypothetical protein